RLSVAQEARRLRRLADHAARPGLPAALRRRARGMNRSLRRYLLAGIIVPVVLFVVIDTVSLYRSALASINTAYDRSLLASARTIGELLKLQGAQLRVDVPYTALEVFDAGNKGWLYYRVNGFDGRF